MVEPQCRYNYKSPNSTSQVGYLLFLSRSIIIDGYLINWSRYDLDSHWNTQSKKDTRLPMNWASDSFWNSLGLHNNWTDRPKMRNREDRHSENNRWETNSACPSSKWSGSLNPIKNQPPYHHLNKKLYICRIE